jgi:hypothetical protein
MTAPLTVLRVMMTEWRRLLLAMGKDMLGMRISSELAGALL